MIGPDKKIKLVLVYPMTTGRNFDEVLRVVDSLQLTARHKVSTPVNWRQGEDVIIAGSVSNDGQADLRRMGGAQALHPRRAPAGLSRGGMSIFLVRHQHQAAQCPAADVTCAVACAS